MTKKALTPNSNLDTTDFKGFLQHELVRRCKSNPQYSLRAFARALGADSSYISKLLNGKRSVSKKVIQRLGPKLGLTPLQSERFYKFARQASSTADSSLIQSNVDYVQLSYDSFQLIADWYHYAILELLTTQGFISSPKWIASCLGVKTPEVNDALERLKRLGMIKLDKNGQYLLSHQSHTTIGTPYTAAALQKLQRQILTMAIEALEGVPSDERDQTAMTMAIDSKLMPEAKERIKKFRRELCAFLQEGRKTDRVYHLSLSLYPVSKISKKVTNQSLRRNYENKD